MTNFYLSQILSPFSTNLITL